MEGEWVGRGTVRRGPDHEPERVYCRVTNRLENGGEVLVQSGRCAAGSSTGRISGVISAVAGGYRGTLSTPEMEGEATVRGDGGRNGIRLNASYLDRESGRTMRSSISISLADAGYRLQATADPGDVPPYSATDITFTRARE
jgi:hypothetical protein